MPMTENHGALPVDPLALPYSQMAEATLADNHPMHCDLCGGSDFAPISYQDRHGNPLSTVLCQGCGLVSHQPVPNEEEVAEYYANAYRRDYHGESTPSNRRIMRAWKNGERICSRLAPRLPPGSSLFEVGAGIGCTVKNFELAGFAASGIEPNRDFNRFTREELKAEVENRNLYDLGASPSYDTILLIHVIEHFSSPTRALTHLHGLIKEGGQLYIECPNLIGPFATYERMFHFAHIYNFTPQTLIALARKCGFELVHQFGDDSDPDIEMLFRKVANGTLQLDANHADQVAARVRQYNTVTYHLRPHYLGKRLRKVGGYALEAATANQFVAELLQRFRN